jgi:PAS domain S-box-containing protein
MPNLSFENAQLNKLFPFHIVLDSALYIESASDAITKIFGEITSQYLSDLFLLEWSVSEPEALTADHLKTLITQPIKMYRVNSSALAFIADVEYFPSNGKFLITGTPYLHNTPETVNTRNTDDVYSESETSAKVLPPEIVNDSSNNRALLAEFASLRKLSAIAEDNINGIVLTDQEGKIQWANRAFEITTGYPLYEILGKRPRDILYGPESIYVPVNFVDENVKKKVPFTFQNIGYTKQNVKFWFEALVHPIIDKHNNIIGRFSSLRDVTQLKEKEKELEINHQLLNSALESSGYGVWIFEYKDGKLKLSDHCKRILGYRANDQLTIHSLKGMVNAEDLERSLQHIVPALSTLRPEFSTEWRIKCNDQTEKFFLVRGSITSWNEFGTPCRIVGTISDINDIKRKDIELEITAKRLSVLLENLNEAILLEDEDRKILLINQSFCQIFSIPLNPVQLIGTDCSNAAEQSKLLFRYPEEYVECQQTAT